MLCGRHPTIDGSVYFAPRNLRALEQQRSSNSHMPTCWRWLSRSVWFHQNSLPILPVCHACPSSPIALSAVAEHAPHSALAFADHAGFSGPITSATVGSVVTGTHPSPSSIRHRWRPHRRPLASSMALLSSIVMSPGFGTGEVCQTPL